MEIKIDTQKDSKEEIKKTIRFLQSIVETEYEESSETPNNNESMFGMFDSEENKKDHDDEPEEKEKTPRVEIFDY